MNNNEAYSVTGLNVSVLCLRIIEKFIEMSAFLNTTLNFKSTLNNNQKMILIFIHTQYKISELRQKNNPQYHSLLQKNFNEPRPARRNPVPFARNKRNGH